MSESAVSTGDDAGFADFLRQWLKRDDLTLERLPIVCFGKVYRLTLPGRAESVFVKRKSRENKAVAFYRKVPRNSLMPQLAFTEECRFNEESVFFFDWCEVRHIRIEDMTDAQFDVFLSGYRELQGLMALAEDVYPAKDARVFQGTIRAYVARHRICGRLLRDLAEMASWAYCYPGDLKLAVNHGDLHYENYGFAPNGHAMFLDFDNLHWGGPAEDLTFAVVHSMRRLGANRFSRRRKVLERRFARMMQMTRWPASVWRVALNVLRLMWAAQKINKKPKTWRTALNVYRRDANLKVLKALIDRYERNWNFKQAAT